MLYPKTNQQVDKKNKIVKNYNNFSYLANSFGEEVKYDISRTPFFEIIIDKNVIIVTEKIDDRAVRMKNSTRETYVSLMIEKYDKKEYFNSGGIKEYSENGKKKNND